MGGLLESIAIWWVSFATFLQDASWFVLVALGCIVVVFYYVLRISLRLLFMFLFELEQRIRGKVMERARISHLTPIGKRILIAGDSTAVGKGSLSILHTIEGRLETDFPGTDVYNVSQNGALTRDILKQLKRFDALEYDLIILSTGGSDLWSLITIKELAQDLRNVLRATRELSQRSQVLVIFFGNVGSAPLFPYLIQQFLLWRGRQVLEVFRQVCQEEQVDLLELFTEKEGNPFAEHPERYFALDGLHPNSAGYLLWYNLIKQVILDKRYL